MRYDATDSFFLHIPLTALPSYFKFDIDDLDADGDGKADNDISMYRKNEYELRGIREFLHGTPFFEHVRMLQVRVDKLLLERAKFERERDAAHQKRNMRKQVP